MLSKTRLISTIYYYITYRKYAMSHSPANFGGTPVVKQKRLSCTCMRAGPVATLLLLGADDTSTRYCMSSPRLLDILTCAQMKIASKTFWIDATYTSFSPATETNLPLYETFSRIEGQHDDDILTQDRNRIGLFVQREAGFAAQIVLQRQ